MLLMSCFVPEDVVDVSLFNSVVFLPPFSRQPETSDFSLCSETQAWPNWPVKSPAH